ncbi:hypothetical protein [Herbiconiux sp.]|uniref:hypothetical protein n=1 Tax=Herbiconiux sp. TaxID=1871186 RepID=UPI0025B80B35|nr:hypothetical protein [Herbiconiux sp.]
MVRIRKTGWKTAYVVVGWLVVTAVGWLVYGLGLSAPLLSVVGSVLFLALVLVGARIFRGQDEPVTPPRAWWRMTAKPTAGFVLGTYFALSLLWDVVLAILDPTGQFPGRRNADVTTVVLGAIGSAPLVFLYLNSSIRLVRNPPAVAPEALPAWKPIKR